MPEITYRQAIHDALAEEMRRDEKVLVFGEDVAEYGGSFKVTQGLLEEFGAERVFDTPISEAAIVGSATGLALAGFRPVAELMSINFALVSIDQIVNHLAMMRYMFGGQCELPVTIRAPGGGGHPDEHRRPAGRLRHHQLDDARALVVRHLGELGGSAQMPHRHRPALQAVLHQAAQAGLVHLPVIGDRGGHHRHHAPEMGGGAFRLLGHG